MAHCSAYLEPYQIYQMELFVKIVKGWKPLTIFSKSFILGIYQSFEYGSASSHLAIYSRIYLISCFWIVLDYWVLGFSWSSKSNIRSIFPLRFNSTETHSFLSVIRLMVYPILYKDGSSRPDVFCQKGVLRNFAKFTGKHLCQSLFFTKAAGAACNFIKKETLGQVFSCEFCEISRNIFFTEHLWWLLLQRSIPPPLIILSKLLGKKN